MTAAKRLRAARALSRARSTDEPTAQQAKATRRAASLLARAQ
jgi:hypothetical protein